MAEKKVKRNSKKHVVVIQNKRIEHNYTWLAGVFVIVLMVVICIGVDKASDNLKEKNASYDEQIVTLNSQIEDQKARREALELRSVYITTKQFVEEFAREKLGLVYEDELIFRPKQEE